MSLGMPLGWRLVGRGPGVGRPKVPRPPRFTHRNKKSIPSHTHFAPLYTMRDSNPRPNGAFPWEVRRSDHCATRWGRDFDATRVASYTWCTCYQEWPRVELHGYTGCYTGYTGCSLKHCYSCTTIRVRAVEWTKNEKCSFKVRKMCLGVVNHLAKGNGRTIFFSKVILITNSSEWFRMFRMVQNVQNKVGIILVFYHKLLV